MSTQAFGGWPAAAFAFLGELEANNDRDWFKANRPRYEELLRGPMTALGEDLGVFGRPHLFRPYTDARFGGPPIKEQVGLSIGIGDAGGYHVEISLDGLLIAAGLYSPQSDQVERLRAAVADGRRAKGLVSGLERAAAGGLELGEPDLKRAPRGYPPDHPRAELLRYKRVVVYRRVPVAKWMSTRAAGKRITETLESATPLVEWLRANVGPSELPRKRR